MAMWGLAVQATLLDGEAEHALEHLKLAVDLAVRDRFRHRRHLDRCPVLLWFDPGLAHDDRVGLPLRYERCDLGGADAAHPPPAEIGREALTGLYRRSQKGGASRVLGLTHPRWRQG